MKVKTEKDLEQLKTRIQNELGIDVTKYQNEEVAQNFAELIVFPQYVISWVIRPVLIALVLFGIGFFVIDLVHIEFILYAILGLVLFFICGVLFGFLFLTWKMKNDMFGVIEYTLDIMKTSVSDVSLMSSGLTPQNRKEKLSLLFSGIIHIVTIPTFANVIANKVPVVGGFLTGVFKRVMTGVANKIKFTGGEETEQIEEKDEEAQSKLLGSYTKMIDSATNGLEKVLNIAFGIARFPLMTVFIIFLSVLIIFLFLIN